MTDDSLGRRSTATWSGSIAMHGRVVGAVIMRDLQTRVGSSYFGFLLGLIFPLGHLGVLIVIYAILGRAAAIGTDTPIFLATGLLPFIIWLYTHRPMMSAIIENQPLLHFPGVAILDLLVSRAIVSIASSTLIACVVITALTLSGHPFRPANFGGFVLALVMSYFLGVQSGSAFGLIGQVWVPIRIAGGLLAPLFYITSGVLFLPGALPQQIQNVLFFLPLTHLVDMSRTAYFASYVGVFADPTPVSLYFLGSTVCILALQAIIRKYVH